MFSHRTIQNSLFLLGVKRVRQSLKSLAGWAFLTWLIGLVLVAPLSSVLLSWHLRRVDDGVVGNEDLLGWFMSPPGLSFLLVFGTLGLLLSVVRFSGYFWLLETAGEGGRYPMSDLFVRVARKMPRLLRLCAGMVLAGWVAALPLVAVLAGIYFFFLGEHDPNYYLAEQPPEWRKALLAATLAVGVWLSAVAVLGLRVFLTLPVFLHERGSLRAAIRRSWQLTAGQARRWLVRFLSVTASWFLARLLLNSLFISFGVWVLFWVADWTPWLSVLIFCTAVFIGLSVLFDWAIGFVGFALLSALITEGYFESLEGRKRPLAVVDKGKKMDTDGIIQRRLFWLSPRPVFYGLFALALGSVSFSAWFFDHSPPERVVLISAHRAGPSPAPENTLAAMEAAIAEGADYAEIDVLTTRDGVVVVTHDADLMRQAGDPRRIRETRYRDLGEVVKQTTANIPEEDRRLETLEAFLQRADGRITLMVELKYYGPDPHLVPAVAAILENYEGPTEVVLMSLDLAAVRALQKRLPDYRVGYVSTVAVGAVTDLEVDFLALARNRITKGVVRSAHQHGVALYAWTPNRSDHIADLVQLGVDGIITDYPARARAVIEEINALSPVERFLLRFRRLLLEAGGFPEQENEEQERQEETDQVSQEE